MRKKLSLIAALIAFFAMTAVSFAANTANINVTSEPITYHALCDKAGGVAMSFDHNTTFVAGDQITADLPMNVSLCKDIDFVVGHATGLVNDAVPYTAAAPWGGGVLPAVGNIAAGPITGDGRITSIGNGVAFWVHGSKGSQRVYIDVVHDSDGDGNLELGVNAAHAVTFVATVGAENTGKMVISILDQRTYLTSSNLYTDNDLTNAVNSNATDYDDIVTAAQNTLCINVSKYDAEYVKLSFDSKLDKYTWIPSDPQVAHVVPEQSIAFAPCEKKLCGRIIDPSTGEQGEGDTCRTIINEGGMNEAGTGYASSQHGYCPETHRNNRVILQETSSTAFPTGVYQIQLEILVNGVGGDQGAYFSGPVAVLTGSNSTDVCAYDASSSTLATTYYNAAGSEVAGPSASDTDCTVAAADRVTKVITADASLFNGTDDDFLWIDVPNIKWDRTLFNAGDTLSVQVTLIKSPCGVVFSQPWCIGTLGCTTVSDPNCFTRIFPYFGKDNPYLNIFGITNTTNTDGVYNLTIYEKDGDIFTATVPVKAQRLEALRMHYDLTVTTVNNAGGGTFGDVQSYMKVSGNTMFEGITFVTNKDTGQSYSGMPGDVASCMDK